MSRKDSAAERTDMRYERANIGPNKPDLGPGRARGVRRETHACTYACMHAQKE